MTHNNHTSTWTEKHLRYCIAQRLTPTAVKLYQWLLGEMREGYTEIIDLRDFQKMVTKERGKPHDFRVIQQAIARLADAGILKTTKKFTNFVWKWTIRPINRLIYPVIPKPKKSQERSHFTNLDTSNDISVVHGDITTTTDLSLDKPSHTLAEIMQNAPQIEAHYLEQNLSQCEAAGIDFSEGSDHVVKLLSKTNPEEVMQIIDYCVDFASRNQVPSIAGLFIDASKKGYWSKKRKKLTLTEGLSTLCALFGQL